MIVPQGAGAGGLVVKPLASGSIVSSTSEQDIINTTPSKLQFIFGWICINNMDAGDRIVIRTRYNGIIHAEEEYTDVPVNGYVYVAVRIVDSGDNYRVTIQQTAGTAKSFSYKFYYQR